MIWIDTVNVLIVVAGLWKIKWIYTAKNGII